MTYIILFATSVIALLELEHYLKPRSPLQISPTRFDIQKDKSAIIISLLMEINNPSKSMEIMVPELKVNSKILSKGPVEFFCTEKKIIPIHKDEDIRKDSYWVAYIIKNRQTTAVSIDIEITSISKQSNLSDIRSVWLDIEWVNYGPFGRIKKHDGFVIPIEKPISLIDINSHFIIANHFKLLPIKTHMLGILDDPLKVIKDYSSHIIQKNDILTIGETPLAVMQGRYKDPRNINTTFLSRLLCKAFLPTSSLATACGMQSLIDLVGPSRVLISFLIGTLMKLLFVKGVFYRLSGEQACLIDDITGTTPPYDQTIVFGPNKYQDFCNQVESELGVSFAVVDVNDLGRVKILAGSSGCDINLLKKALKSNPAGNANQQTPLVLIRP